MIEGTNASYTQPFDLSKQPEKLKQVAPPEKVTLPSQSFVTMLIEPKESLFLRGGFERKLLEAPSSIAQINAQLQNLEAFQTEKVAAQAEISETHTAKIHQVKTHQAPSHADQLYEVNGNIEPRPGSELHKIMQELFQANNVIGRTLYDRPELGERNADSWRQSICYQVQDGPRKGLLGLCTMRTASGNKAYTGFSIPVLIPVDKPANSSNTGDKIRALEGRGYITNSTWVKFHALKNSDSKEDLHIECTELIENGHFPLKNGGDNSKYVQKLMREIQATEISQ